MTRALIRCDGAAVPRELECQPWDLRDAINYRGGGADLTLRMQNVSHALRGNVEARAADLVRIAAYVYAADQIVGRGGLTDIYGDRWRREFWLCVPVNDPDFWSDSSLHGVLSDLLTFLSEDSWTFRFSRVGADQYQLPLESNPASPMGWPDSVFLFSGGADSLCAVIEEVTARQGKPALVSHRAAPYIDHRQHNLIRLLRERLPQWDFPYTSVWVHRRGTPPNDSSQRTRSFLYSGLGAVVANAVGASRVVLADNGVVSLNLPISDQLVGALASRSTHPKFIHQMNCLLEKVLPGGPVIANTLWDKTRPEGLALLKGAGLEELLQESNSCSNTRGLPNVGPHCGVCLQCVDRRFATIAAGLQDHDLKERYKTDVFRHDLPEGKARDTAVSYLRFARRVSAAESDDDLLLEFPQLQECVLPTDPSPDETARRLICMLRRHADAVLRVLAGEIGNARHELAIDCLPVHSLLRLAVAAEPGGGARPPVPCIKLSEQEETEFQQARFKSRLTIQITGQTTGRKSNVVVVDGNEAFLDDADFIVFLRLALELLHSNAGFLSRQQLRFGEGLQGELELMPQGFDQALGRVRKAFRGRLRGLKHTEFIEVQRRKVRLSTHWRYVSWNEKALRQHVDERVRLLVDRMASAAPGREPQQGQGPA